jgi:intracellular multiplication and macrophage-killing protein
MVVVGALLVVLVVAIAWSLRLFYDIAAWVPLVASGAAAAGAAWAAIAAAARARRARRDPRARSPYRTPAETEATPGPQRNLVRALVRVGVVGAGATLAATIVVPMVSAYTARAALVAQARRLADDPWPEGASPSEQVSHLDVHLWVLDALEQFGGQRAPLAERLLPPEAELRSSLRAPYLAAVRRAAVEPVARSLEQDLDAVVHLSPYDGWATLKAYLLLGAPEHLADDCDMEPLDPLPESCVAWAVPRYAARWEATSQLRGGAARIDRHLRAYLLDLRDGSPSAVPVALDAGKIGRARQILAAQPDAYVDTVLVRGLGAETYRPGEDWRFARSNYRPVWLATMFQDRPDIGALLVSDSVERSAGLTAVRGAFTASGHYVFHTNLARARPLFAREAWVLALSEEAAALDERIARAEERYEARFVEEWRRFLGDLRVPRPRDVPSAVAMYAKMAQGDWVLLRVLRNLTNQVSLARREQRHCGFLERRPPPPPPPPGPTCSRAAAPFTSLAAFAGVSSPEPPRQDTELAAYMNLVAQLRRALTDALERGEVDATEVATLLRRAAADTQALVGDDPTLRELLLPLLLAPFEVQSTGEPMPG